MSCIVGHWIPSLRQVRRCQVHPGRNRRRRAALQLDTPQVLPLVAGVQLVEVLEYSPLDGFLKDSEKMRWYKREVSQERCDLMCHLLLPATKRWTSPRVCRRLRCREGGSTPCGRRSESVREDSFLRNRCTYHSRISKWAKLTFLQM